METDVLVCDLIRRICVLMGVEEEPRMYLRMQDGTELGQYDVLGHHTK